ncbi:MAG: hypothetical protein QNJ16_11720 [Rhodobacter sp.]|nr:hypothetical protein [Rhodobacter sp.]
MPEQSYNRLVTLRGKIEASSHAEVIRRALQLYEALIEEAEKGGDVSIRSEKDGEVRYRPIF